MKLLGALLLCATFLTGTTGLPTTDGNRRYAAMRAYEAGLLEAIEEFDSEEDTGDSEMAIQEAKEIFESYIENEDVERDMDAKIIPQSLTIHTECPINICLHGNKCILDPYFNCICDSGYAGHLCQFRKGRLLVIAKNGTDLPDTDGRGYGDSDPYISFTARNYDGNTTTKTTRTKKGTENPNWNDQEIDFGTDVRVWKSLTVQVFDRDKGQDDALSGSETFSIERGSHKSIKHCANNGCKGYIYFDYDFD